MKVGNIVSCNQCGILMGSGGGEKCSCCNKLNNNFASMATRGSFDKEVLSAKCKASLDTMDLIVKRRFCGNLEEATIPRKAKLLLYKHYSYPTYEDYITKMLRKNYSLNSIERLEEYQKILNTNNSKETL